MNVATATPEVYKPDPKGMEWAEKNTVHGLHTLLKPLRMQMLYLHILELAHADEIFEEAGNRLHAQKAIMVELMKD